MDFTFSPATFPEERGQEKIHQTFFTVKIPQGIGDGLKKILAKALLTLCRRHGACGANEEVGEWGRNRNQHENIQAISATQLLQATPKGIISLVEATVSNRKPRCPQI